MGRALNKTLILPSWRNHKGLDSGLDHGLDWLWTRPVSLWIWLCKEACATLVWARTSRGLHMTRTFSSLFRLASALAELDCFYAYACTLRRALTSQPSVLYGTTVRVHNPVHSPIHSQSTVQSPAFEFYWASYGSRAVMLTVCVSLWKPRIKLMYAQLLGPVLKHTETVYA